MSERKAPDQSQERTHRERCFTQEAVLVPATPIGIRDIPETRPAQDS